MISSQRRLYFSWAILTKLPISLPTGSLESVVCVKTADEAIPQCLLSTTCWVRFVSLCSEHPVLALGICLSP